MNFKYNDRMARIDRGDDMMKRYKSIIIWIIEIVAVILLAFIVVRFGVEKMTITGDSMSKTLEDGNKVIINKMSYIFSSPKRYDLIAFDQSGKEHSYYNVKRVIGLPGETVQIKDGYVYINNKKMKEKTKVDKMITGGLAEEPIKLEDNEYFVLGDNRNLSEDSRFASVGNVLKSEIVGKAWFLLDSYQFTSSLNLKNDKSDEESKESGNSGTTSNKK